MASPTQTRRCVFVVPLVAAPFLLLAADVVGIGAAHPLDRAGGVGAWTAQHVLLLLGTAAMIPVLLALMRLAEERKPWLGLTGAALGIGGVVAAVSILALDFAAVQVAESGDLIAMRAVYARMLGGPVVSALDALQVALPLGTVVLGLVLLGDPPARRAAVVALIASAVLSGPSLPVAVRALGRLLLLTGLVALVGPASRSRLAAERSGRTKTGSHAMGVVG